MLKIINVVPLRRDIERFENHMKKPQVRNLVTLSLGTTISSASPERIGEKYRLCRSICAFHFGGDTFMQRNY
jgi:hypothetical protein